MALDDFRRASLAAVACTAAFALAGCAYLSGSSGGAGTGPAATYRTAAVTSGSPQPAPDTAGAGAAASPAPATGAPAAGAPPAAPAAGAPAAAVPPPPPPPILPFDQALARAAEAVFNGAEPILGLPAGGPRELIIDPLIDASTGQQTVSSVNMGKILVDYVNANRKSFTVKPFTRESLARSPVLMIGTLTAVNSRGDTQARADAYRIWLTLVDLRTGRVVGKSIQRSTEDTVDARPTEFFQQTPTWVKDRTVSGYINSCQVNTRIGDPIDTNYLMRLPAAAVLNEAIIAYNERRYAQAYQLYQEAGGAADPNDLRVLNGLYLSAMKLHRTRDAQQAFDRIVTASLQSKRLALKILFVPGGTQFVNDAQLQQQYPFWIRKVAEKTSGTGVCLTVVGHTSHTGTPQANDALSEQRAKAIRTRLATQSRALDNKVNAVGVGFRENLVGSGTDDSRDAVDRRVEFRVVDCPGA